MSYALENMPFSVSYLRIKSKNVIGSRYTCMNTCMFDVRLSTSHIITNVTDLVEIWYNYIRTCGT